jgi:hypothetical protein
MAEKLNGPGFGARMAMAQPTTSTRAMQAKFAEQQDQLRQLLSYCETNSPEGFKLTDAEEAYRDVAGKLRAILDGE